MRHYYHSCKTSGHGIAGLVFAVPLVALCALGWTIAAPPFVKGFIALLGLGGVLVLSICLRHMMRPEDAFIEISETQITWKDWQGWGMRQWAFPLDAIVSLRDGRMEDTGDYLVLKTGLCVRLPSLVIPDEGAFFQALQKAAPHVQIEHSPPIQA